ncbi:Hint domain-containing protein [Pseudotabrizicola sediminis]|nr:Hint domain-containing protein [Pseudotabrizicola sediminis]
MTTISFFARQDSITANNAVLNPIGTNQAPTTTITFTDNGGTGDLLLDSNGGMVDPDTQIIINGVTYNFSLKLVGKFPVGSPQVPDVLEGKQVALITVAMGNQTREYFFVTDGTATLAQMNGIGNGAIPLDALNTNPPPFYPCFCAGTMIETPSGRRSVETLSAGDYVLNDLGEACQIMWVSKSTISLCNLRDNPNLAPIRIPADAFGAALPTTDLYVSPQHRVVLEGTRAELFFGEPRVFAAAKHLVGTYAETEEPTSDIEYFHILTEDHEIVLSNGLPTETFQPARRTIDVMLPAARKDLEGVLSVLGRNDMFARPDALPSLRRGEVRLLAEEMYRHAPDFALTGLRKEAPSVRVPL